MRDGKERARELARAERNAHSPRGPSALCVRPPASARARARTPKVNVGAGGPVPPALGELASAAGFAAIGAALRENAGGFMTGDHAALALDPSFWPIHPALERVYLYKLLRGGGFTDEAWDSPDDAVCSKGGPMHATAGDAAETCFEPERAALAGRPGEPAARASRPTPWDGDACCYGHGEHDRWYVQYPHTTAGMTNREALDLLDVRSRAPHVERDAPVYHHLRWDHCDWFVAENSNAEEGGTQQLGAVLHRSKEPGEGRQRKARSGV